MVRSPAWFWPAFWRSRPPPRSLMVVAAVDMVEASAVDMVKASAVADILAQGVYELGLLPASSAVTRLEAADSHLRVEDSMTDFIAMTFGTITIGSSLGTIRIMT